MANTKPKRKGLPGEGLTSIHPRIHCAATPDGAEKPSEADDLMINSFIETLAEVAEAVARRRQQRIRLVE